MVESQEALKFKVSAEAATEKVSFGKVSLSFFLAFFPFKLTSTGAFTLLHTNQKKNNGDIKVTPMYVCSP